MMTPRSTQLTPLAKTATGITGLDDITTGGLPTGRPTLIAGNAGCGKTLLGIEFLVNGAIQYDEPGVFMSFEESISDLIENVASLGYDLEGLIRDNKFAIDYIKIERHEIEETGEYDLEGLFIRMAHAIDSIHAKRIVLDTLESLFGGFQDDTILRAELRRLFHWLKDKGITTVITGERGESTITRQGLEEYVSDCVILLDHRVEDQISTRRLRVVKYRGSTHGTNEYPFLIDSDGITVMPITSLKLDKIVSSKRISSGIKELDTMTGGGFYEGSNILVSGTAGTGKTSLSSYFVDAACNRKERALFIAFEESPAQIIRNAKSIGLSLQAHVENGLLKFEASRSTTLGLEMHLATIYKEIEQFNPSIVVVDPITNLITSGNMLGVRAMLGRLMDMLKQKGVTALFTSLTQGGMTLEQTEYGVSSFVDTWILLRDIELNGERNRVIHVLKSRGTSHSNQVREFVINDNGIHLVDVYMGPEGVLTGTARIVRLARDESEAIKRQNSIASKQRKIQNRQHTLKAQIASLTEELRSEQEEMEQVQHIQKERDAVEKHEQTALQTSRNRGTNQKRGR
jgi:circadian clock protein KaiC